ncbi:MAG: hypothetical protein HN904_23980 [Victivallales bacterium]|nr:hypothetical protein [Victivallales bacterium]
METHRIRFFDDREVAYRAGLHLEPVPVEKHGVLMDREGPSDLDGVSVFCGSVVPLPGGTFRMYYYAACYSPRVMRIAIAESSDGFHWERRLLGQQEWEGAPTNHLHVKGLPKDANITQPSVVLLPDGRWFMYCWLHGQEFGQIRYLICTSEDGLNWELHDPNRPAIFHPSDLEVGQAGWTAGLTNANPKARFDEQRTWDFLAAKRLRSNDATYVYYNEQARQFEMYSVWLLPNPVEKGRQTPHDNAPGALRIIHRRTSENGLDFSAAELVISPDEGDPLTQQFYYLSQHQERDWRIGFLGSYHCWDQTMECEMCFSRDGRHWDRPFRGGFIPRGPIPETDCMSVYATNCLLPVADDRVLMLYRGGNYHHNHTLPEGVDAAKYAVMGASWPKGRFAGLATAPRTSGRLLLKPQVSIRRSISLDATIRGGVRAELRDVFGGALPGYGLHDSELVVGDGNRLILRWGEVAHTSEAYQHDAVVLYLELADATLYSVSL